MTPSMETRLAAFAVGSAVPSELAAVMGEFVATFVSSRRHGVAVPASVQAIAEVGANNSSDGGATSLTGRPLPDGWAAWANVLLTGGTDHPVALAALAVAETEGRDLRSWAEATARGVEVAERVQRAIAAVPDRRPFDAHVVGCHTGAVLAAVSVLGLAGSQAAQAVGTAAMQTSGVIAGGRDSTTSALAAAWAAKAGVDAARLVTNGFAGPADGLSGPTGLLAMHRCAAAADDVVASLGTSWLIGHGGEAPAVPLGLVARVSSLG